jgi:hypothetical protein
MAFGGRCEKAQKNGGVGSYEPKLQESTGTIWNFAGFTRKAPSEMSSFFAAAMIKC